MTSGTRVTCLIVLLFATSFAVTQDAADSVAGLTSSDFFSFQGRVVDPSGNGIADAAVHLVAGVGSSSMEHLGELNPVRGRTTARTNSEGSFKVTFAKKDSKFIINREMSLVVSVKGHQHQVQNVARSRIHCDAPFVVNLSPEKEVLVTLTNAANQPLSSARVYPALHHGVVFPACVPMPVVRTNEAGEAKLNGTHPDALTFVYAEHPAIGNQRVAVYETAEGRFAGQAAPSRKIEGRIQTADNTAIPGLEEIKLLVRSCDRYQYSDAPNCCGWDFVSVEADGSFEISQLSTGHLTYRISCPAEFAWRDKNAYGYARLEKGDAPFQWHLEYQETPRSSVTILDPESDLPLPNVHISTYDQRLENTTTDELGKASFYCPTKSYMPIDPVGDFFFMAYQYAESPPVDNVIEFPPYRMQCSTQWKGLVVDGQGKPYPGAKVTYEQSSSRNAVTFTVYSNSDGSFSLQGVADGTAIKLQANTDVLTSEQSSVLLPESNGLQLTLRKKPLAQPVGRIVDLDGNPVVNASVAIKRLSLVKEAKFARENINELYQTPTTVRTGQDGRFAFPPTKDLKQRLRIELNDARYFSFRSPAIDGSSLEETSSRVSGVREINLGEFRVMRRPDARTVSVRVRSKSGSAIPDATVVLAGARTGKATGKTDSNGETIIPLSDGSCVVAVRAKGHQIDFRSFTVAADSHVLTIVLHPCAVERKSEDTATKKADRKEAARQLLADMGEPEFGKTSHYRVGLYVEAFASLDPEDFAVWALRHGSKPEVGQNMLRAAHIVIRRKPELLPMAAAGRLIPGQHLSGMYLLAANITNDDEKRMDWLGEAMVTAKARYQRIDVIAALLAAEEHDLAVDFAKELWNSHSNLQKLVTTEQRNQQLNSDAATLGPVVAVFDLDTAHRLIELAVSEDAIEQFKTQATLNWGLIHRDKLIEKLDGRINVDGVEDWMRNVGNFDSLGYDGLPHADKLASMIDTPSIRLRFLLFHAKLTSNLRLREQLVNQAIDAINESSEKEIGTGSSYLQTLIQYESLIATLPSALKDEVVFAAIKNLPPKMEAVRIHHVLASAARIVGLRSSESGRTLLEPAFQDRGWMFGRTSIDRLAATGAVARIDPEWAIELASELCKEEYKHNVVDQLEMRSDMVQQLMSN